MRLLNVAPYVRTSWSSLLLQGYWDWSGDSPSIQSLLCMPRVQLPAMQTLVFKLSLMNGASPGWVSTRVDGLEHFLGAAQLSTHHGSTSSYSKNVAEFKTRIVVCCGAKLLHQPLLRALNMGMVGQWWSVHPWGQAGEVGPKQLFGRMSTLPILLIPLLVRSDQSAAVQLHNLSKVLTKKKSLPKYLREGILSLGRFAWETVSPDSVCSNHLNSS